MRMKLPILKTTTYVLLNLLAFINLIFNQMTSINILLHGLQELCGKLCSGLLSIHTNYRLCSVCRWQFALTVLIQCMVDMINCHSNCLNRTVNIEFASPIQYSVAEPCKLSPWEVWCPMHIKWNYQGKSRIYVFYWFAITMFVVLFLIHHTMASIHQ